MFNATIGQDLYEVDAGPIWDPENIHVIAPSGETVAIFPAGREGDPLGARAKFAARLATIVCAILNRAQFRQ